MKNLIGPLCMVAAALCCVLLGERGLPPYSG